MYWDVLGCNGLFLDVLEIWDVLVCSGMYWNVLESVLQVFKV